MLTKESEGILRYIIKCIVDAEGLLKVTSSHVC